MKSIYVGGVMKLIQVAWALRILAYYYAAPSALSRLRVLRVLPLVSEY